MALAPRIARLEYPAGLAQGDHCHESLQLSMVLRGAVCERVGTTAERGEAFSVVVKDPGVRHANQFGSTGAGMVQVSCEGATLSDPIDAPSRATAWQWRHDPTVARPFMALMRSSVSWGGELSPEHPHLVDLLAAITARRISSNGTPPSWLVRVREALREEWRPGLSVAGIAAAAQVHPVYLARCMRRWFGTGVAEELRRARLLAAGRAISSGAATVSRIAHELGYSDEAHLCREFGRAVGITPGRYRRLLTTVA